MTLAPQSYADLYRRFSARGFSPFRTGNAATAQLHFALRKQQRLARPAIAEMSEARMASIVQRMMRAAAGETP